jgi:hypothetical protein
MAEVFQELNFLKGACAGHIAQELAINYPDRVRLRSLTGRQSHFLWRNDGPGDI